MDAEGVYLMCTCGRRLSDMCLRKALSDVYLLKVLLMCACGRFYPMFPCKDIILLGYSTLSSVDHRLFCVVTQNFGIKALMMLLICWCCLLLFLDSFYFLCNYRRYLICLNSPVQGFFAKLALSGR